jgi:membrane protein DedA with SNARE-associated domain
MIGLETIIALASTHGLAIVAPLAVIEGPIVTVIAAWLASRDILNVWAVSAVVIAADLVGDLALYALGRWGLHKLPKRWRDRLGLNRARLLGLAKHFRAQGNRTLVIGKLTHTAGAAVLVAAGLGKVRLWRFFWVNLLATIPKSLFFVMLGYSIGSAYARIDNWITRASLILGGVLIVVAVLWFVTRWARKAQETSE